DSQSSQAPRVRSTSLRELIDKDNESPSLSAVSGQLQEADNQFTQEELTKYWKIYAESLGIEKTHLKSTLINCLPTLGESYLIEVSVHNPLQKDEIKDCSIELLRFLAYNLKNTRIKIEARIVEKNETASVYTAAERYNYLSSKNPNLEKLKNVFNLTLE
ncbi:MAG: DNA polymerase III subunit gamma/tau, partial [Tannerella sp.]|nr:DNA polymerase III subunit gamma/tau [Tannerella sp.]